MIESATLPRNQALNIQINNNLDSNTDILTLQSVIDFSQTDSTIALIEKLNQVMRDYRYNIPIQRSAQNFIYILFITKLTMGQRKELECYITERLEICSGSSVTSDDDLIFWGHYPIIKSISEIKMFVELIDDERGIAIFQFIKGLGLVDNFVRFDNKMGLGKRTRDNDEDSLYKRARI